MIMKKAIVFILFLVGVISAQAQFGKGTKYVGASMSGFGMSYSTSEKFQLGIDLHAGYFVADCLMLHGIVGYEHSNQVDNVNVGAAARYYFDQCGVFMGAGAEYQHHSPSHNDVMIPVEVGYAFYVNHFIAIEPSVYYKMSLHDFSDNSTVGLKIGLGFYF